MIPDKPSRSDNYLAKLYRLACQLGASGSEHHIQVRHDGWCGFFHGRACNCNPIVKRMREPPKQRGQA